MIRFLRKRGKRGGLRVSGGFWAIFGTALAYRGQKCTFSWVLRKVRNLMFFFTFFIIKWVLKVIT